MKFLKYIIYCLVVLSAVACAYAEDLDGNPTQIDTNKPTVPLKKRPIVPSTKLPRPRVVEDLEVDVYVADEECQVIAEEGL